MDVKYQLRQQFHKSSVGGISITSWDHWQLYLNPPLCSVIVDRLEQLIKDSALTPDYLCPIPKSGIPIASQLSARLGLPLLNFWWGDGVLARDRVSRGAKIVLFDADIKSSKSLHFALGALESITPDIQRLVTVIYHDLYPSQYTIPFKQDWFDTGKLLFLYRMSELLV